MNRSLILGLMLLSIALPVRAAPDLAAGVSGADPLEPFNRSAYRFTDQLDQAIIRPTSMGYQRTPAPLRQALRNVFTNLSEPGVALNDALQGRLAASGSTWVRFAANSTFGILGLVDVAKHLNLNHHNNGFGLTLGRYGLPAGPYLFLPMVGPMTLRDGVGAVMDLGTDPLSLGRVSGATTLIVTRGALTTMDRRAEADADYQALRASATDGYATVRSVYLQSKDLEIRGAALSDQTLPDFDPPAASAPR